MSYDVVVVGGGLAGLTAGVVLREKGLKVILVEAAGQLGGRVKTHPELSSEYPCELGAEFIHGPTNKLMDLVNKYGLEKEHIFTWAQGDGGPSESPVRGGVAYYFLGKEKQLLRYDDDNKELKNLNEALWDLEEIKPEEWKETDLVVDYLKKRGVKGSWLKMADAGYANTVCNTLSELPLLPTVRLFQGFAEDGEGEFRILPSWQGLLSRMGDAVEHKLRWEVKKVNYGKDKCEVISADGEKLTAKRVIVTAPVPIVRDGDIAFSPALPKDKTDALKAIKFNPCFKVAFRFNRRFWPKDMHGVICSDCVVPEWWALPTHDHPKGGEFKEFVLTGFTCCGYSTYLTSLSREEMKKKTLSQLDAMFGTKEDPTPATSSYEDFVTKDWTADRFIRGGYSSCGLGNTEAHRVAIAAPVQDRLFFAGEHCHPKRYMVAHAAMETGEQAAHQVLRSLAIRSKL